MKIAGRTRAPHVLAVFLLGSAGLSPALAETADTIEPAAAATDSRSLTEFAPDESSKIRWIVVNDGVMGGLSQGHIAWDDAGILRFRGDLSLENNGGFSSIRTTSGEWDLADQAGIALRVRGDGRTYQFRLESDARYRGMPVSFSAEFPTTQDQWLVVHLPFTDFRGGWRGRDLPDKVLNPSSIRQLGVLLGDKQEGPFAVEIDWIRTFAPSS